MEVGNVMPLYFPFSHTVVDKYDPTGIPGIVKMDVVDHKPEQPYDLINSISTLEHVGWDEKPKEPEKVAKAFEVLKRCLAKGGKLVTTLPVGYNSHLDTLIKEDKLGFTQKYCLKRVTGDNQWEECPWQEVFTGRYGHPFSAANLLVVGVIQN